MSTIQVRIDEKTKQKAGKVFENMGLDISKGIRLFLRQTIMRQGLPFQPMTKNGFTMMQEREILRRSADDRDNDLSQEDMHSFISSM